MTNDAFTAQSAAPDLRMELPGPNAAAVIARDEKVTSPSLTRLYPLVVSRGRGLVLEDVDGNRFLDFNAGIAVVAAGHAHPDVNAAIHAQVDDVLHYCSSDFYLPVYADVCEKLAAIAPFSTRAPKRLEAPASRTGDPPQNDATDNNTTRAPKRLEAPASRTGDQPHNDATDKYTMRARASRTADASPVRVFLSNSGTEAVEAALKLVRHHTGRPNVIAFLGGFHGRSLGSLSLTASKARQRAGFGALMPGSFHAPYWDPYDADALTGADYIEQVLFTKLTHPSDVAGIFVEPLQGEGGYIVPPAGWLAQLRELCDRHDILLVLDEVQSGIGRTGTMWACEHDGVEPDIMTVGKGLASGLPLAGVVARSEIMDWEPGGHGSTFGGNPVACAAAIATIDLVENGLADNAAKVGSHLLSALAELQADQPLIEQVRGRGLMIGVDLPDHDTAEGLQEALFRRGLLTLTCGERTLRLAPPLIVTIEQADVAIDILRDAVAFLGNNRGR